MLTSSLSPWPSFSWEEAAKISDVLLSNKVNYWTGSECREFEKEFAEWTGARFAVALANGTVALEVALRSLGIAPGDEVIVTPRTFLASASCIVNLEAKPVFADVDRWSQNITVDTIAAVVTPRTKAIICVHLAGHPCDMDPIMAFAREHHIYVIEDCAQAHGARYKGRMVGSIGDIGAWSFCQDKIMTTGGEGGMITTSNSNLWSFIWSFKDHGKSWNAVYARSHSPGFRWVHESFGTNYRMLEIQAAIGRIQLRKLSAWTAQRRANAEKIVSALQHLPVVRIPPVAADVEHAFYKFYVFVVPEYLADGWSRDRIVEEISAQDIPCSIGSCPEVYLERAFDHTGYRPAEGLPVARELGETSLMFLVHPTLTAGEVRRTCSVASEVLAAASLDRPRGLA